MLELTPKFKLFPDSPYKTIVGVIDPKLLDGRNIIFFIYNLKRNQSLMEI